MKNIQVNVNSNNNKDEGVHVDDRKDHVIASNNVISANISPSSLSTTSTDSTISNDSTNVKLGNRK